MHGMPITSPIHQPPLPARTDVSYSAQQFIGGHRLKESAVELVHSSAGCAILDCPYI